MKKNIFKTIALLFCMALCLSGCATVSNITNQDGSKIYYDDVQYFQGQVALIGDYLYYGNGYTASDGDDFNYNDAASTGYLARLYVGENLQYDLSEDDDGYVDPSPVGVEKVNDKLTGYQNQYMFALGDYLYFTSANTHKLSNTENDYTRVSIFRVKFNGDGFKEIDTFRYDENSQITVQKGGDGNYYYIIYCPSGDDTFNLYSVRIGSSIGETTLLAEDVLSVAICDENSSDRNVIYTVTSERSDRETTEVRAVDFATGEDKSYSNDTSVVGTTTTMLGRVGDIVFYSYDKVIEEPQVYYKDLSTDDSYFSGQEARHFYDASDINIIDKIWNGYLFISTTSSSVMYKEFGGEAQRVLSSSDYSDILFVDGDYLYYSNSTSISRISIKDLTTQTLVSTTSIISGECGYDGTYIYYFAQLESEESEEDSSSSSDTTTDENYYMHRVDKFGNVEVLAKVEKP